MPSSFILFLYLGTAPLGIVKEPGPPAEAKDAYTIEYGYEERAPLYFGKRKSGELLLKKDGGKDVWVKPTEKAEIQSFEDILAKDHMTYFTQHWDTKIYADATTITGTHTRKGMRFMPPPRVG